MENTKNTVEVDEATSIVTINETINAEGLPVEPGTIARTVVFVVAWINQLFAFVGLPVIEFDPDVIYLALSSVFTFVASTVGYWMNNSWTIRARIGDLIKNLVGKAEA